MGGKSKRRSGKADKRGRGGLEKEEDKTDIGKYWIKGGETRGRKTLCGQRAGKRKNEEMRESGRKTKKQKWSM